MWIDTVPNKSCQKIFIKKKKQTCGMLLNQAPKAVLIPCGRLSTTSKKIVGISRLSL